MFPGGIIRNKSHTQKINICKAMPCLRPVCYCSTAHAYMGMRVRGPALADPLASCACAGISGAAAGSAHARWPHNESATHGAAAATAHDAQPHASPRYLCSDCQCMVHPMCAWHMSACSFFYRTITPFHFLRNVGQEHLGLFIRSALACALHSGPGDDSVKHSARFEVQHTGERACTPHLGVPCQSMETSYHS